METILNTFAEYIEALVLAPGESETTHGMGDEDIHFFHKGAI
jgi:hypothetical protein